MGRVPGWEFSISDAVCVPLTPIYTPSDVQYIANDSEADAIVCADTNFGYVKQVTTRKQTSNT